MELIVVRGLPGSGKTEISKGLLGRLPNAAYIEIDKFKRIGRKIALEDTYLDVDVIVGAMVGSDIRFRANLDVMSRQFAYDETFKTLDCYLDKEKNYVIVDELFCDKVFFDRFVKYVMLNGLRTYWFRIERPMEALLAVEADRKRPVKNSLENFVELGQEIDACKVKNEVYIVNSKGKTIEQCVDEIVGYIL